MKLTLSLTVLLLVALFSPSYERKARVPNEEEIQRIRDEAKLCENLECMGKKCYELYPYAKKRIVTNIEEFAEVYHKDLVNR